MYLQSFLELMDQQFFLSTLHNFQFHDLKVEVYQTILRPFGVVLRDNPIYLNKDKHYTHLDTQEL